ncbi:MAG: M15 family metallopeptidase [Bacteroidota bacterium]
MRNLKFIVPCSILLACSSQENNKNVSKVEEDKSVELDSSIAHHPLAKKQLIDSTVLQSLNLVKVTDINPSIFVDLKYASADNFMHQQLYAKIDDAYLLREVAVRLGKCQDFLNSIDPKLHLLVYDAIRPVSVQQKMWDALDSIPVSRRGLFVSNPKNRSVHNYGAAVDITICDAQGKPLDMGAGFDDIRKIAYPSKEQYFLEKGELTQVQVNNRKLLRRVMNSQKFSNIPSEWWHFNAFSRKTIATNYKPLLEEF